MDDLGNCYYCGAPIGFYGCPKHGTDCDDPADEDPQRPEGNGMDNDTIHLADGRSVPASAVAALDELEHRWPGATLPQARPAIVAAVMAALS